MTPAGGIVAAAMMRPLGDDELGVYFLSARRSNEGGKN
jgi:hypothetical protein